MNWKSSALIAVILVCAVANSAGAGIYNNAGTATREDSIAIYFQALDSLGSPVDMASGDSVYFVSFGPGGWIAFRDSMAYNNARITGADWEDFNGGQTYTAKYAVADIDGAGVNGTYRYVLIVDDNTGANLQTSTWGEFQLYTTNDISAKWDSTTQIPTGEITTGSFTAGAIDAAAIADGAIGVGEWAAEADNNGINWGDVTNQSTSVTLSNTQISSAVSVVSGVTASVVDVGAITTTSFASGAIDATAIATGAITSDEIATSAANEIGFAANNMGDDSAAWISGADTSAMMHMILGGQYANLDNMTGTLANSQIDDDVDVNVKTASTGAIEDQDVATLTVDTVGQGTQIWSHGTKRLTELDEDNTTIDLNATSLGNFILSMPDSVVYRIVREVWRNQDTANVDTSKIGTWLALNLNAAPVKSSPDSVVYRNAREVWRNQDTVNVDTSKMGMWLIANTSGSGSSVNYATIADTLKKVIHDSLGATVLGVSEIQSFLGACDECYYRLFPEGGTANKDSAIVIDGSVATSDSLLGKIIYLHGTTNSVYDTAFFYTRPWW